MYYMYVDIQFTYTCTQICSFNKLYLVTSMLEMTNWTNLFCQLGFIGWSFQETYTKKDLKNIYALSRNECSDWLSTSAKSIAAQRLYSFHVFLCCTKVQGKNDWKSIFSLSNYILILRSVISRLMICWKRQKYERVRKSLKYLRKNFSNNH